MDEETRQFVAVYDWMLDLHLPGRTLLVYALIHGFTVSQGGCFGSRTWMAKRLRMDLAQVSKAVKRLIVSGLVLESDGHLVATGCRSRTTKCPDW